MSIPKGRQSFTIAHQKYIYTYFFRPPVKATSSIFFSFYGPETQFAMFSMVKNHPDREPDLF